MSLCEFYAAIDGHVEANSTDRAEDRFNANDLQELKERAGITEG